MSNITQLDLYDAIGNSLESSINKNFNLLNIRMCRIDEIRTKLIPFFNILANKNSDVHNFITAVNSNSSNWNDVSTIVYNANGYWLEPITIMYQKTFSVVANFQEIETWLNTTFPNHFVNNQILKISFTVKNFDPTILNNTQLSNITQDSLNHIAATYNQNTLDIQSYLSYLNHVNGMISTINNIFKKNNRNDILIKAGDTVTTLSYISSFIIHRHAISSSLLTSFSNGDLKILYSVLTQLNSINDIYQSYIKKGINVLPTNILNQFNRQGVFTTFVHSFCFLKNTDNKWAYIPDCNINFCANNICNDCYDTIDVNTLYTDRRCKLPLQFQLVSCS